MTLVSKPEKCENKGIFMPRIIWSLNGAGAQQPLRRRFDASAPERTFLFGRCIVKNARSVVRRGFTTGVLGMEAGARFAATQRKRK